MARGLQALGPPFRSIATIPQSGSFDALPLLKPDDVDRQCGSHQVLPEIMLIPEQTVNKGSRFVHRFLRAIFARKCLLWLGAARFGA